MVAEPTKTGMTLPLGDGQAEQLLEVLLGERLALEVLHHELVVGLGGLVGELLARGLGDGHEVRGDLVDVLAVVLVVVGAASG